MPMLFPYADKNTPFILSPESLDWYLSKGWYRMGGHIFTTHFLYFNDTPFSAIWLRRDLKGFAFSKSQRKLLRRNAKQFNVSFAPRVIDTEREALFTRYAEDFNGRLSPSISDSLEDYNGSETIFNTWETTVRDKVSGQLVANSYFDLGDEAAASILGVYDPLLKSFSLGYYTMLLEIQYCLDNNIRYYYPGYVVPGYGRFDYKLRIGGCDYYDLRQDDWRPFATADIDAVGPVETQRNALERLAQGVSAAGITGHPVLTYPLFEAGIYDMWNEDYLPYPFLFPLGRETSGDVLVVAYDPKESQYFVLQCFHKAESQLMFNHSALNALPKHRFCTDLLSVRRILFQTASTETVIDACRRMLQPSD